METNSAANVCLSCNKPVSFNPNEVLSMTNMPVCTECTDASIPIKTEHETQTISPAEEKYELVKDNEVTWEKTSIATKKEKANRFYKALKELIEIKLLVQKQHNMHKLFTDEDVPHKLNNYINEDESFVSEFFYHVTGHRIRWLIGLQMHDLNDEIQFIFEKRRRHLLNKVYKFKTSGALVEFLKKKSILMEGAEWKKN